MIQRIQSVYLLVAGLALSATLFFPLSNGASTESWVTLTSFGATFSENINLEFNFPIVLHAALVGIAAIVSFAAIALFKKRMLQVKLSSLIILLSASSVVTGFFGIDAIKTALINSNYFIPMSYGVAAFLPIIALILTFLASRAIRKDEELVRAADRLR